jgi:hypothetical protein
MPTAKAPYSGKGWEKLSNFSTELRQKLRSFAPAPEHKPDSLSFGDHIDSFVEHVLAEAWWAKSELYWLSFEVTKAEMRTEVSDLLKRASELEVRLRSISPDVDRLLSINADPLGCADKLRELARSIELAEAAIDRLPQAKRDQQKERRVAVELAVRIIEVLISYKLNVSTTYTADFDGYTSDVVRILKMLGDDLQITRDESTWLDIIIEAKKQTG